MKFKKVLIGMFIAGSILTLSACGSNNSSTSSKNEPAPRPTAKTPTLAQALKDHKFWYYFHDKKVTKDSTPSSVIVSKGNGKVAEYPWNLTKAGEENLAFSDYLKLDDKEKLSMLTLPSKVVLNDYIDAYQVLNKVDNSDLFENFKVSITTDDTGNYTKYESLTIPTLTTEKVTGGVKIEKDDSDLNIINSYASATIYDHSFEGYTLVWYFSDHPQIDGSLLTETGNENIQFQLDSPKDASKHITVDGK